MEIKPIHYIFAELIRANRRTLDEVPEGDREAVESLLETPKN